MDKVLVHDISHHQGDLTAYWPMFKTAGCQAVIIKATEGYASWNIFIEHARQAKGHGFLVGSYHYFRQQITNLFGQWVNCDPERQARNYFDWVMASGVEMDLPPALDVENGNNPTLSVATITKCLQKIEEYFGRKPFVYSSPSILIDQLNNPPWGEYPLWLAHYTSEDKILLPAPWDKWTLWQFSDKVTYNRENDSGYVFARKPIDHNWFNGSRADLLAFCHSQPPAPGVPDPDPVPSRIFLEVTANFLRLRHEPAFYAPPTLIVEKGQRLELLKQNVTSDGITWHEVAIPGEYGLATGFVSASSRYVKKIVV